MKIPIVNATSNSAVSSSDTAFDDYGVDLISVRSFLGCATPCSWLEQVEANLGLLLIDHANCEKKAASTALNLLYKYIDRPELLHKLSKLAREELRHFEQVLEQMARLEINYEHVSPSRYAAGMRQHVATHEPAKLVDTLIVSAFIEARSCERFALLVPVISAIDSALGKFYLSLLKSEARHFKDYLSLAGSYALAHNNDIEASAFKGVPANKGMIDVEQRIDLFGEIEADLVTAPDSEFRFHSGSLIS